MSSMRRIMWREQKVGLGDNVFEARVRSAQYSVLSAANRSDARALSGRGGCQ